MEKFIEINRLIFNKGIYNISREKNYEMINMVIIYGLL